MRMQAARLTVSALFLGATACAAASEFAVAAQTGAAAPQAMAQPETASAPSKPAAPRVRIEVMFKLDPRLSGGSYGGEHWVSPTAFTSAAQIGTETNVEARVTVFNSRGEPLHVGPTWSAADPTMVSVAPISPGETDHVQITVKRLGQTKLAIAASGVTKELRVAATAVANGRAIQVEIGQ